MKLYVGNLSHDVTEDDLQKTFEGFGQVATITIIKDKFTGQSRGFGFIEMPNNEEAQEAIAQLNGQELKGRMLKVNESFPQQQRPPRRGGPRGPREGGGGSGWGGGGGGGGGPRGPRRSW